MDVVEFILKEAVDFIFLFLRHDLIRKQMIELQQPHRHSFNFLCLIY